MSDYAITAVARRVVYTGSAGVGPYSFNFPILVQTDLAVYKNATLLTLTSDYTVSIGAAGTGSVTLVSAATGSDNITITGARAIERSTDFVTAGDLFASSLNTELDSQTIFVQQVSEDAARAIRAPVTDPTSIDMTLPTKASRAGKTLAFDSDGNPVVGEDIGNWRGNWAASTAYTVRDLVKDASNYNVYRCNTAHTSSGTTPVSGNADAAKWDLVVDAAYTATQASNAASSASAAATSASNASASASAASTSASNSSASASASSTSASNSASSASAASTSASNASSSASAAASSASAAAASAATAATYAGTQSVDNFNGDGSTTAFTMSSSPATENNTSVYISGIYQQKDTYSISGTTLTFSSAPPTGTGNIEVMHMSTTPTGVDPVIGTVTTGAAGSSASVTATGHTLDFTIPRGDTGATGATGPTGATGATGPQGPAATIAVGTVTTGAAGSSATVTNSGTSGAATFDFSIPKGDTGATGPQGIQGETGPAGSLSGADDGSAAAPSISFSADTDTGLFRPGADQIGFTTGGTSAMTISGGRLITGHNTSISVLNVEAGFQNYAGAGYMTAGKFAADAFAPFYTFVKSRNATVGAHTIVQNGDDLGTIAFTGSDGTDFIRGAQIRAQVDGTPGLNDMPGRLTFFTTADGASSPTERMRLTASGSLGLGTSSPDGNLNVQRTAASAGWIVNGQTVGVANDSGLYMDASNNIELAVRNGSGTLTGAVRSSGVTFFNGGNVGIGTSSPDGKLDIATGGTTDVVAALGGTFPAFTYRNGTGSWFHAGKHPSSDYFYIGRGATPTTSVDVVVDSTGNVGIGVSPSYKLHVDGDIYATGDVTAYSSAAAKDNITTIPDALDLVEKLRGVTFKWKESGKKAVGLIYEEVKEVVPELTSEKEGHVGVAYQNTVALLIEAVKTLSAKVKELESK